MYYIQLSIPACCFGPLLGELPGEDAKNQVHHEEGAEHHQGEKVAPLPAAAHGVLDLVSS